MSGYADKEKIMSKLMIFGDGVRARTKPPT